MKAAVEALSQNDDVKTVGAIAVASFAESCCFRRSNSSHSYYSSTRTIGGFRVVCNKYCCSSSSRYCGIGGANCFRGSQTRRNGRGEQRFCKKRLNFTFPQQEIMTQERSLLFQCYSKTKN